VVTCHTFRRGGFHTLSDTKELAMKKRVSIHDVATAAGVSATTVSHALNGKGRMAPATRDRIKAVATELGYRPHPGASNLAGGRTGLLGLAVSQARGLSFAVGDFAYFMQLMGAATQAALDRGFALVLVPVVPDGPDPFERVNVDGAIIIDPVADDDVVRRLRERGLPVVTTGRVPGESAPGRWVDNDHVAGTRGLLGHLERAGATRIAHVTTAPITSFTQDTLEEYNAWMASRGVPGQVVVARGDLTEDAGFAAAEQLLDGPEPPDAIFATLDRLALGVLRAAQHRGLVVPDDLLIAGYTDSDAARWTRPSLTAMRLNPDEIGRRAVELLVTTLDEPAAEQHVHVPTRLLPRASTRRTA
jgi:DNA-binding LacI/PurR family transcriptional regulator